MGMTAVFVKTFSSISEKGLDRKVNDFLQRPDVRAINVQFQYWFCLCAMVTYERVEQGDIESGKR
jgi:hypothetical protein